MLRLRDIMTRDVLTLEPEMTLREAIDALTARHVSGAPVVAGRRVIGVVSVTDLLEGVAGASFVAPEHDGERDPLDKRLVGDIMTPTLHALTPDAPVERAAAELRRLGIHRLLVMDEGELAGIVTAMDVAAAVADRRLVTRQYVFERGARA